METKFRNKLVESMKAKNLSESSIKSYVRNLEKLNDNLPLMNLNFLSDVDSIINKLSKYKENTKRSYLISINSALETLKDSKKFNKLYETYYKLMNDKSKEIREKASDNMNVREEKNWISWEEVKETRNKLLDKIKEFENQKVINESQYNLVLQYMILSLYIDIPPRRNMDYQKMNIIKTHSESIPKDVNYLVYDDKKFIFNIYKTSKKYGGEILDIPEDLLNAIKLYLKFHPLIKGKKLAKTSNYPFLVYYNGKELNHSNSITRILNDVFDGRKLGSSGLRHIYVSTQFSEPLKKMEETAKVMGHDINTMITDYIKKDIDKLK